MRDDLGACALGESSERLRDRTDRPSEPGTTWLAGCRDRNWSELSRSLRGTFWTTMRLFLRRCRLPEWEMPISIRSLDWWLNGAIRNSPEHAIPHSRPCISHQICTCDKCVLSHLHLRSVHRHLTRRGVLIAA